MIKRGLIESKWFYTKELGSEPRENKNDLHFCNEFVFVTVCTDPAGPGSYFKEVVQERLKILPANQVYGLMIEEPVFFQLAIDFCNYFNSKYQKEGKAPLRFAIDWLEDMRKHPEKHKSEWDIWNKTVEYVLSPDDKHLIF